MMTCWCRPRLLGRTTQGDRVPRPARERVTVVHASVPHKKAHLCFTLCARPTQTEKGKLVARRGRKVRDLDEIARPPVDATEGYLCFHVPRSESAAGRGPAPNQRPRACPSAQRMTAATRSSRSLSSS